MKSRYSLCALLVAALLAVICIGAVSAAPAGAPQSSAAFSGCSYYTVRPGDNLFRISQRFGVSMYAVMQANGISNANRIYAGQVLCIPTGPAPHPSPVPPSPGFYYTVASGDTLAGIAARFGTTVYAIMQANGLANPNNIYPGQVLWIPTPYRPPQPVSNAWRGEYYNNERLAGAPSVIRYDAAIDFDWGLGWPHPKINADNFSVRWTRSLRLSAGVWRFTATTDDGVRLYVDNVLVIDQWHQQPATAYTADVPLGAGYHTVRMEYFELTGTALARLHWQYISMPGPIVTPGIPYITPTPGAGAPSGYWLGQYYDNMYLGGGPALTRMDVTLSFDWGYDSPDRTIPKTLWSARWVQTVSFDNATYRFHAIADDGVRVYVDDQLVMNEWHDAAGSEYINDKPIAGGNHVVKVEYYQNAYQAKVSVWWEKLP